MTLSKIAKNIADMTLVTLANDQGHPTMDQVRTLMTQIRQVFSMSDSEFEAALAYVESRHILSMAPGTMVAVPKFERWLAQRKSEIDPFFWSRFRRYLIHDQGWGPAVVNKLDETVDEILEYAGDPLLAGPWKRRGLVVGDVQSGKTATYTALCNKAADAGYRLIILLAGTLNSLRFQTQERLDEGFVGRDSAEHNVAKGKNGKGIGVGAFDNSRPVLAFTTKLGDFDANVMKVGTPLDGLNAPALMVIKKNKVILENVHNWLRSLNSSGDGQISVPLLLIDDEADAASVNTGKDNDPRAINKGIRKLLELFSRSSYVGFTATPFANVFISPDSTAEMLGDDLFPSDYIYSLEPPSNYVGPVKVFGGEQDNFVRLFDDAEAVFPRKHKTDQVVSTLPHSLTEAMRAFLLANAIRDLRLEGKTHRSMLVNVSWANNVQRQVGALLKGQFESILAEVQAFARLEPEVAFGQSKALAELKRVFDKEYGSVEFTWREVQFALYDAIKAIEVRTVNMSSPTSRLNYEEYKSTGLRVVAIGGNALSRGLTLYGLSTSYIFRNSQAYDTLLQMGRWFGYRPNYEDVCRIYMSVEAANYYTHITLATQELRAEFRRMRDAGSTPRQFGLKVRAHPDALTITARNKMKSAAQVLEGPVSLSRQRLEATQLFASEKALRSNEEAVARFLRDVATTCTKEAGASGRAPYLWVNVPKELVAKLLRVYEVHPDATRFQPRNVANFLLDKEINELSSWDVGIISGDSRGKDGKANFHGFDLFYSRRITDKTGADIFQIRKRRLGAEADDSIGMSADDKASAERDADHDRKKYGVANTALHYRGYRRRPLLLVYIVEAGGDGKEGNDYVPPLNPFVAISLSFPRYIDDTPERQVVYQANQVWQQMKLAIDEIDEDELVEQDLEN